MVSYITGQLMNGSFMSCSICSVIVVISIVCLIKLIKALHWRRVIDIRAVSLGDRWVAGVFDDVAFSSVAEEYNSIGKPLRTKKGPYRTNFLNDVNKEYARITKICCDGDDMSRDLCSYAETYSKKVRAKDLYGIISGFLEHRENMLREDLELFLSECDSVTPEEFFEIRQMQDGDVVGVYIIHNESRDMYYVGQAKKLFFRINQHLTGHGNGDVYADYKYGDDFSIKIVRLSDSGYADIDLLEKDLINKYDAYNSGYNRTVGNGK